MQFALICEVVYDRVILGRQKAGQHLLFFIVHCIYDRRMYAVFNSRNLKLQHTVHVYKNKMDSLKMSSN